MVTTREPTDLVSGPSWRRHLFRPAAEGALRRRARDWFGLIVGVGVLILTSLHHGDVTRSERAFFDLFNTLPNGLAPAFRALYRLGALWAVGLVVVAALVARRRHLARDLVVAGLLAWASARALGEIVDAHEGITHTLRIAVGFGGSPSAYPSARVAVIVAVIGASAPYVSRPARVFGWAVVALLGASALYLGTAFPNDLFAGVVLGVTVASFVHLVFGSPGVRPSLSQVTEALALLGLRVNDIHFAEEQPRVDARARRRRPRTPAHPHRRARRRSPAADRQAVVDDAQQARRQLISRSRVCSRSSTRPT